MQIFGWKGLLVSDHRDKFGEHRYRDTGDMMLIIYHVTSHDHTFKGLSKFKSESYPQ